MNNLGLTPGSKAQKKVNPDRVLFFNPELHAVSYSKLDQVYIVEKLVNMVAEYAVESSALNWRQRKKYANRKVRIGRKVYYIFRPEENLKKRT